MPHHDSNGPFAKVQRLARRARAQLEERTPRHRSPGPAAPDVPAGADDAPRTTLDATIRPETDAGYTRLVWAPGEGHLLRTDLGGEAGPDRSVRRRSLLYFAHHTDAHVCDAQSPSRLEPGERFAWFNAGADGGHRPQEACTAQVLDQMVRATNAVLTSPASGAAMAWCVQTGDNTDNRTRAELAWFTALLDGGEVVPNTGAPDRYEGIQRSGARWSYQADDPSRDVYGRMGYPALPGFLDAAVRAFPAEGLAVPWLAVMGNHDAVLLGTFGPLPLLRFDLYGTLLVGAARKPLGVLGMLSALVHATVRGTDPAPWDASRFALGTHRVTPDPESRAPVPLADYLAALVGEAGTDDEGHGFTAANRDEGTAWWSRPEGPSIQLIGLDTCNHTGGSEGVLCDAQFRWLEGELARHHTRWRRADGSWAEDGEHVDRLCILFSHHNSWTMTNSMADDHFGGPRHLGPELVALLHRFPNVVLWVNGHSHEHRIIAHARPAEPGQGFWEVNTASCIDFGQQARTIELLDNRDGTLSVLTTVLDHAAPPSIGVPDDRCWTTTDLASMSRELSANDARWVDPFELLGRREDRNTELLLAAPFPLA